MKLLAQLRSWCKWLAHRSQLEREMESELQFHRESYVDDLVQSGLSEQEARRRAQIELGGTESQKDAIRFSLGLRMWDELRTDLGFAWRMLRRNPGFTTVAVITLALGIGANTAIFSVVNAVLLRPFPYPHSERLVTLSERAPGLPLMYIAMPNLEDWRTMNTVFESIEGYRSTDITLTGNGDPQRLSIREVSAGFFPMLGVTPILGRPIMEQDDQPGARPAVLLSETFWTREFARDPMILHKQLILDGQAFIVIGVVPSNRLHMTWRQIDAFTPLGLMASTLDGPAHRDTHNGLWAYARLKPGVTIEQARADMNSVARRLEKQYPADLGQGVNVNLLQQELVRDAPRRLELLMGAVVLVLLIACGNVGSLLMSLAVVRRREIAVRSALGAGASRLARQHLCESLLLALSGGALGLVIAYAATSALGHLAAASLPRIDEVSIDHTVLLFTLAISLLTGIVFGVFPALMALRVDPNEVLKDESHGSRSGLTRMGLRGFLVAGELALSLVLLVATGLTIKSLVHLLQTDLGFQAQRVLTASLSLPSNKYTSPAQRAEFIRQFVAKVSALPGVRVAGFADRLLGGVQTDFRIEGHPAPQPGTEPYAELAKVTPGALEALGVQPLYGRFFKSADGQNAPLVCIIDDALAEEHWPGESALGKRLKLDFVSSMGLQNSWWSVVGVVHHLKLYGAARPALPEVFLAFQQFPTSAGNLLILSDVSKSSLEPMVREELYSIDPTLAINNVAPLAQRTDSFVAPQRLSTALLSILAGIALLLAAVGTYSVMACMVAGRTQEIGVRRALGAQPLDVLHLVLRQGMYLAFGGLLVGFVTSVAIGHIFTPMLFGVKATDPLIFASVGGLLLAVAMAASYIPARRAMRLNPIEAVRHE